jgi:hypothetical protein
MKPVVQITKLFVPSPFWIIVSFSILLIWFAIPKAFADETHDILDKARVKLSSKKNQAHIVLKIIESSGEVKVREMDLKTLQLENGFEALVRMTAPIDNKGTALLALIDKGEQRQWIYLPSNKQVRRVASVNKSSGLLGSELSPEDLNPEALKGASVKILKRDASSAVVQLTPAVGTSEYTTAQTTFSIPDCLPQKSEYYKGPALQKTVEFLDYKSFDNIYRAQKIHIKNVIKNRGTDIELTHIDVNAHLSEKDFTPDALKENW